MTLQRVWVLQYWSTCPFSQSVRPSVSQAASQRLAWVRCQPTPGAAGVALFTAKYTHAPVAMIWPGQRTQHTHIKTLPPPSGHKIHMRSSFADLLAVPQQPASRRLLVRVRDCPGPALPLPQGSSQAAASRRLLVGHGGDVGVGHAPDVVVVCRDHGRQQLVPVGALLGGGLGGHTLQAPPATPLARPPSHAPMANVSHRRMADFKHAQPSIMCAADCTPPPPSTPPVCPSC